MNSDIYPQGANVFVIRPGILVLCALFSLISLLPACSRGAGGGSSGQSPQPSIVIDDPDGLLSSIGVTSVDELATRINEEGVLTLVNDILSSNSGAEAEEVMDLLVNNNARMEFSKLEGKGIPGSITERLAALPVSPAILEDELEMPSALFLPGQVSESSLGALKERKREALNRRLNAQGLAPVGSAEFDDLINVLAEVDLVDNFGNLNQSFQNLLVRESPQIAALSMQGKRLPGRVMAQGLQTLPAGYQLLNAELDLGPDPLADPVTEPMGCRLLTLDTPLQMAGEQGAAVNGLLRTDGNDLVLNLPDAGIAHFVISVDSSLTLQVAAGDDALLNQTLTSGRYTLDLPVSPGQVCSDFTFAGLAAVSGARVVLEHLYSTERMSDTVFLAGESWITGKTLNTQAGVADDSLGSFTFSTLNYSGDTVDLAFAIDGVVGADGHALDYVVYQPDGSHFAGNGIINQGNRIDLAPVFAQRGIWRVDIFPPSSFVLSQNQFSALQVKTYSDERYAPRITPMVKAGTETFHGKEFVLATVQGVALKTQGEASNFSEGEIILDLNSAMVPRLEVPSYMEVLEQRDINDENFLLWRCWRASERTGNEFTDSGACNDFRTQFFTVQNRYESEHRHDYSQDAEYFPCVNAEGQNDVCLMSTEGAYEDPEGDDAYKARIVMADFSLSYERQFRDAEYLNILENYQTLYEQWKERTVINDQLTFPHYNQVYKTRDWYCGENEICMNGEEGYLVNSILGIQHPVFAAPVERMAASTLPLTLDFSASEQDVPADKGMIILEMLASQAYNIYTANLVGLVCGSVDLVDNLHQASLNAKADMLGSARAVINRFSAADAFYGLEHQDQYDFVFSGYPEQNGELDTFGQRVRYAQLACAVGSAASAGMSFASNADTLLNLDTQKLGEYKDVVQAILATSSVLSAVELAEQTEAVMQMLQEGRLEDARQSLKVSNDVSALTSGQDIYDDVASLQTGYTASGSSANGNNVLKSTAQFLLGEGERKARANVRLERVDSVPVNQMRVLLKNVHILSNAEDGEAEISINSYVGVIGDKRDDDNATLLFSASSDDYNSDPVVKPYDYFTGVMEGDDLYGGYVYSATNLGNVAAVYLEFSVAEKDGRSVESDDMIGILSTTLKLEEIFNAAGQHQWTWLQGNNYQLVVDDYPVYNSANQLVVENPFSDFYEQQKKHNAERRPSALISFSVDVTLGDLSTSYPPTDVSVDVGNVNAGHETWSMDMSIVNQIAHSYQQPDVFDVFDGRALIGPQSEGQSRASVVAFDPETFALQTLFDFDLLSFSGDLLPIKEALSATENIGSRFLRGTSAYHALPGMYLLSDNRLLFVISHTDGARLMMVRYTDQGVMTLLSSALVSDAAAQQVKTLLQPGLSPSRAQIILPLIPASYATAAKSTAPQTEAVLYRIGASSFERVANETFDGHLISQFIFLDENNLAAVARPVFYDPDPWGGLGDICTTVALNCPFSESGTGALLMYNLNAMGRLTLVQASDVLPAGYRGFLSHSLLRLPAYRLQPIGQESRTQLMAAGVVYQLNSEGGYFFYSGNSRPHGGSYQLSTLRYNTAGGYYCSTGITCSGMLSSALGGKSGNDIYRSDEAVGRFEIADAAHDLILAFDNEDQLYLINLYSAEAYKGPHLDGSIFGSTVRQDGTADAPVLAFNFSVTDRDTRIDLLDVSVSGTTTAVRKAAFAEGEHSYSAACVRTGDGVGTCHGEILLNFTNASLTQEITVTVSDGTWQSVRTFSVDVERELPHLSAVERTIALASPAAYTPVSFILQADNAASATYDCAGQSNCTLRENAFIDSWTTSALPAWLSCTQVSASYGDKVLSCSGTPPMGSAGDYPLTMMALQNPGQATETSTPVAVTLHVAAVDNEPDTLTFNAVTNAELSTLTESSLQTVSGLTGYASISIVGGEYWRSSLAGWTSASAADLVNGEQISVRVTSAADYGQTATATLTIGSMQTVFSVTTKADPAANDTTPDAFSFTAVTEQPLSTVISSNSVIVSGINQAAGISVSGGEYSMNSGKTWSSSAATINNGQSVRVRHTSAASYSTDTVTVLTIGGVSGEFRSTTLALPLPDLSSSVVSENPSAGDSFSFIPLNTGGAVSSWSVNNKPDWATFNTNTGELSGTVGADDFVIDITATNASGSYHLQIPVVVIRPSGAFISAPGQPCTIDDDTCVMTFTDDSSWRAAISSVTIEQGADAAVTLTEGDDYSFAAGTLTLKLGSATHTPKHGGDWLVRVQASGYQESTVYWSLGRGALSLQTPSVAPAIAAGVEAVVTVNALNRFGFTEPQAFLQAHINVVNVDTTLTEQYRLRQDEAPWQSATTALPLMTDSNGVLSFTLKVPGCVDQNDGFSLVLSDNGSVAGQQILSFLNGSGACVNAGWTVREQPYTYSAQTIDSQGNSYWLLYSDEAQHGVSGSGGYDLYLNKYDRNGEHIWTRNIGSSADENADAAVALLGNDILVAGTTSGDIDGAGSGTASAGSDLFMQRFSTDGTRLWSVQTGTGDALWLKDLAVTGTGIYLLSGNNSQSDGDQVRRFALDGSGENLLMGPGSVYGSMGADVVHFAAAEDGTLYLAMAGAVMAYDSAQNYLSASRSFAVNSNEGITDMLLDGDSLYVAMNTTAAVEGEALNNDGYSAVRVLRLRLPSLSAEWGQLIQHDGNGRNTRDGHLAVSDGVVFVSVATEGELYYDAALADTPFATLSLVALRYGNGAIIDHHSWIADANSNARLNNRGLSTRGDGWFLLGLNANYRFADSYQLDTSGPVFAQESVLLNARLAVTAPADPLSGIVRNIYGQVVTDYVHSLQWIDSPDYDDDSNLWSNADHFCQNNIEYFGYDDWRLPTETEMDRNGYIPVSGSVFLNGAVNGSKEYWTSTASAGAEFHITVVPATGVAEAKANSEVHPYRCVRNL